MRGYVSIFLMWFGLSSAWAGVTEQVVDIPTRPGVTQRFLLLKPDAPKAAVILFAGGHGGLDIGSGGGFGWGAGNFLVRSRSVFAERDLLVAVIDKPSDLPNLQGRRQTSEHVEDVRAVIGWLRQQAKLPVWLVGTSRGTQSAAYVATRLAGQAEGPDGIVLTATILSDSPSAPVPAMPMNQLKIPVLVVHHEQDGCKKCAFSDIPSLMNKLTAASRQELMSFTGGVDQGNPCEARAYHGFNGIEQQVVDKIAAWIVKP